MGEQHAAFTGSVPENYDLYLGPTLFEPYARDLASRLEVGEGASVLELACGTGVLTRILRDRLPRGAHLTATDLNEAMMASAARKFGAEDPVSWRQADMTGLPFGDELFDAAVCQFGFMFVPDKARAFGEAYRVLKPGGSLAFTVWDAIERNDHAHAAHTTVSKFFESDPPTFYQVPYSLHDPEALRALAEGAGFREVEVTPLALESVSPSAEEAARGLVEGTPVIGALRERGSADVEEIKRAVAEAIAARCGDRPVRGRMRAYVCTARRPA
ncbi:MAG TPA: methyltransferase domain-containing protein [Pyrinomonadaceae bacterium]